MRRAERGEGGSTPPRSRLHPLLRWVARTLPTAVVLASLGIFARRCLVQRDALAEDAYITFRFARHLADGLGLVWNVGGEWVEGYTSPLHVLLLAAGARAGLPLPGLSQALGVAAALGIVAGFIWLVRRETGGFPLVAALMVGIFAMDTRLAIHATAGLETLPYTFGWLLSYAASLRLVEAPGPGRALQLAVLDLLCLWGRPDAGAWIAGQLAVLALLAWRRRREPGAPLLRALLLGCTVLLGCGLAYLAWKWHAFGYLLPNPFYLKSNQLSGLYGLTPIGRFLQVMRWQLLVVVPGLLLADWKAIGAWWRDPLRGVKLALLGLPVSLFLLYYLTVIHEVSFAGRFEYPTYIFFCLAAGLPLAAGRPLDRLQRRLAGWVGPLPALLAVIGLVLGIGLLARRGTWLDFPWFRKVERSYYGPIAEALRSTGLGPRATLVFRSAGIVPYRSEFSHIDPVGLTDNTLSGRTPIGAEEREHYIWGRHPDVYIGPEPPASPGARSAEEDPRIRSPYVREVLLDPKRFRTALYELRHYGGLSDAERARVLHLRMRELRDHWFWLGEIPYPVPQPPRYTSFAYVRRDSPHAQQLVEALEPLIRRGPDPSLLEGPPAGRGPQQSPGVRKEAGP